MKIITRLYILQIILIGAIIAIMMVVKLTGNIRLNLFLKSSHANNERMVENILKIDREVFMRPLHDNSEWDETVKYIANPAREFEMENLNSLLSTFLFNHIWVFDQNGKQIYYINDSVSVNLDTIKLVSQINDLLTPKSPFCHFFINTGNEVVEISGATVVSTSDTKHTLPAKGYLFFGRNWNREKIKHLEEITGSEIQLFLPAIPKNQTITETPFTINYNLPDLKNRTVGKLIFTFPAYNFQEWKKDTTIFTIIVIIMGLFIILIIGFLSRQWLVVPLKSIIRTLDTGKNQHLQRLKSLNNEFGQIARLIENSIITNNELQVELKNKLDAEKVLTYLKNKAEESYRLKTAFLSNMSHEIRTPMNGILGFAGLLQEPNLTGEEQQEYVRIIEKSGRRMLNIINDIVDISKIESGLMEVDIQESNINDQLEYIYAFFKPEVERKRMLLILKNTLTLKESIIKTDREKIYAILTNLVKNAIKYTDKGTIEFGCTLSTPETFLQFYVKDTGIGIPGDRQEAIFERFIQADISDKHARQGAGLGLAISKAYVEILGGKIRVESEPGKGSTFYFTIPYHAGEYTPTSNKDVFSREDLSLQIRKLKILIAEDDETSDFLITSILNLNSNEVSHVNSGELAVEFCRNDPHFDLVLMDLKMAGIGGYEATRQIRQFNKSVIIIAQTAYGLSGDREKALESGCNDYILKPINKEELLLLLHKYFNPGSAT